MRRFDPLERYQNGANNWKAFELTKNFPKVLLFVLNLARDFIVCPYYYPYKVMC